LCPAAQTNRFANLTCSGTLIAVARQRRGALVKIDDGEEAKLAERMIEANGVELCTEAFGDPADPPILLVMGIGGSMLWWDERLCRMLADGVNEAASCGRDPSPPSTLS
jgi:hypothetical protein